MQITLLPKGSDLLATYVIECIELKDHISDFIGAKVFEDPAILKVMHSSASNDIGWLQRDFGIMVANVFDVQFMHGKLTKKNGKSSNEQHLSLSKLWEIYCSELKMHFRAKDKRAL